MSDAGLFVALLVLFNLLGLIVLCILCARRWQLRDDDHAPPGYG